MLKQFLLNDCRIANISEHDIDVMLKTHIAFANKDLLARQDLNLAFEDAFN